MRRTYGITFFIALLTLTSGCASYQTSTKASDSNLKPLTTQEQADQLFEVLDVDGNSRISREEARNGFKYLIASYDRSGKSEILAAKPGDVSSAPKKKPKRRPTTQDADRAFEALFQKSTKDSDSVSKDEFKKLVVKAADNPETDPFIGFY